MKDKFIIALSIFLFLAMIISAVAWGGECSDCPENKPCWYTQPAGDGCNTCSGTTWCMDDKWYTTGLATCTLLACQRVYEIPKPYKGGVCEEICKEGYTPDSLSADCKCIIIPR